MLCNEESFLTISLLAKILEGYGIYWISVFLFPFFPSLFLTFHLYTLRKKGSGCGNTDVWANM